MSDLGKRMPKEYSDQFDKLRQNRNEVTIILRAQLKKLKRHSAE